MTLQGDLSTLDITNLFQSLETGRKTGLLTVRDGEEETQLFFEEGQLTRIAYAKRPGLIEYLVAAGAVTGTAAEKARKQRRRGQAVGAALVEARAIAADRLSSMAAARLTDETCEVLSAGASRFEFAEVGAAPGPFDPEEGALGLSLAVSPLLLESARRSDHWALIREQVPSDAAAFVVAKPPREPADRNQARLQAKLVPLLDGSRSVREVVGHFPARRFEVYQLLADLSKTQTIRPIAAADVNRRVIELARRDPARAKVLLERALEQTPHHLGLLLTKAALAERAGEREAAREALQLALHLQLDGDDKEAARATLTRLKDLDENDPFAWERSLDLAIEEKRAADAVVEARRLIEIYRKPGLHRKAAFVLERLIRVQGERWSLVRELARERAAAGDRDLAVKGLEAFAASLVGAESYPLASKAYEEILSIQPTRAKAQAALQDLKSGAVAQRRARWRSLRRRVLLYALGLGLVPWLAYEAVARRAYVETSRSIVAEGLLESRLYGEARVRFEEFRARYRGTTTAIFDVSPMIEELDARIADRRR